MLISSGNARPASAVPERAADASLRSTCASHPKGCGRSRRRRARRARASASLFATTLLLGSPHILGAADAIPAVLRNKPVHVVGALYRAIAECRSALREEERWKIADAIESNARRHGYDPLFVQAMVETESMCLPTAKSPMGALGLIQVKPSTARAIAEKVGLTWSGSKSLLDPDFNVNVGLAYLNQLGEQFDDPHAAIAAYNLGPRRVEKMNGDRVKKSRYVREILHRYEQLLDARAPTES